MRVLVVEDAAKVARFLTPALQEADHAMDIAGDGIAAGNLAHLDPYDLLLLDAPLPRRNGLQVAAKLRQSGMRCPIVMLTPRGPPAGLLPPRVPAIGVLPAESRAGGEPHHPPRKVLGHVVRPGNPRGRDPSSNLRKKREEGRRPRLIQATGTLALGVRLLAEPRVNGREDRAGRHGPARGCHHSGERTRPRRTRVWRPR